MDKIQKKYFAQNVQEGTSIEDVFFIKTLNEKKDSDKRYYMLSLLDKTGTITGNIWTESYKEEYRKYNEKFVKVKGTVILHQSVPKIKISQMNLVDPNAVNIEDFVYVAPNLSECFKQIQKRISEITSPSLKQLVQYFYGQKEVVSHMLRAPGGSEIHHDYVGGFVIHTTSVLEDALSYSENYKVRSPRKYHLNKDLIISGALFHDIGKLKEYKQAPIFKRTKSGKLMGHILLGIEMVSNAACVLQAQGIQLNEDDMDELKHIIASSHYKDGPISPQTMEAMIIANSDRKDSDVSAVESQLHKEGFHSNSEEDVFTNYNRFHETSFYFNPGGSCSL